jgi:hypothetical protein
VQIKNASLAALALLLAACGGAGEQPAPTSQGAAVEKKSIEEKEFFIPVAMKKRRRLFRTIQIYAMRALGFRLRISYQPRGSWQYCD